MAKEKAEQTEERLEKKISVLTQGEKWNFEEESIFIGRPTEREQIIYEDDGKTPKQNTEGQDMNLGRYFEDEGGDEWVIPHYASIDKALNQLMPVGDTDKSILESSPLLEIIWQGKKTTKAGKPYHQFEMNILAL